MKVVQSQDPLEALLVDLSEAAAHSQDLWVVPSADQLAVVPLAGHLGVPSVDHLEVPSAVHLEEVP